MPRKIGQSTVGQCFSRLYVKDHSRFNQLVAIKRICTR